MATRHELEVTVTSAKDLKNVNWRHGDNKPYAVVWVDPSRKVSTNVDREGDTCPHWDEKLKVPVPGGYVERDATLYIDVVHAGDEDDTKKLIGSAKLKLIEVYDEAGLGEPLKRNLTLKRPSGRPHGKVEVKVVIREPSFYPPPGGYHAPSYGTQSRDYPSRPYDSYGAAPPPPYGYPTSQPPVGYQAAPPPTGYQYGGAPGGYQYGGAQGGYQYGGEPGGYQYGGAPPQTATSYSSGEQKKSSKFGGMGTGLAVGAVAGVLGGIALVEGAEALEDHIADKAAEKVEDDYGDGDDYE